MEYDFLKQFSKRMKSVGMYSTLIKNSWQKTTWKQYGFESMDEQVNIIYSVLLFIMEYSLREQPCTIDDISVFVDDICNRYLKKGLSYEKSGELAEFIINVVLCDEGRAMYFDCFDFDERQYKKKNISYLSNEVVYIDGEIKRTSYKLTDNGYNLVLSTLEVENNLKLTIHEMIFKMHLERATYDQALDEVKNIFNMLRIQLQKIQEAMDRIRRNALNYSVEDYEQILNENMLTISDTKHKFMEYRRIVRNRVKELEDENINIKALNDEDLEKLQNLQEIERYLSRSIDEHQKILNKHFDLKDLYSTELEKMSKMTLIKRFSLRNDLYDKIIEHPGNLINVNMFLNPLFRNNPRKIYNLNKCIQYQKPLREKNDENEEEQLDFDIMDYEEQKEKRLKKKLKKYKSSMEYLVDKAEENGGNLELAAMCDMTEEQKKTFIPNAEIFKEIMVEFIKAGSIDIDDLRKERKNIVADESYSFQLNEMLLKIADERKADGIKKVTIRKCEDGQVVCFKDIYNEFGDRRNIYCSNVVFKFEKGME